MAPKKGPICPKLLAVVSSGQLHQIALSFGICVCIVILDFLLDFLCDFAEASHGNLLWILDCLVCFEHC